jgi:hypothetical protein
MVQIIRKANPHIMERAQASNNPLLAELKSVHDMLRRDLAMCRKLAVAAANGATPAQVRAGLDQVRSKGPLFQLRANCVQHCHAVRSHHEGEDAGLFRSVRRSSPDLRTTVDQLQAEHQVVSDLLDQVEGAARGLENSPASRIRLADALNTLSVRLLAHLDFEEKVLGPALLAMNSGR